MTTQPKVSSYSTRERIEQKVEWVERRIWGGINWVNRHYWSWILPAFLLVFLVLAWVGRKKADGPIILAIAASCFAVWCMLRYFLRLERKYRDEEDTNG